MKERDLMIGDLVTYTGDDEGPITASIEGINEDSDFGIEILGTCERIEDIEPIPLTAEILEKNGYSKVNGQRYDIGEYESDFYIKVNPKKHFAHVNGKKNNVNLYDCKYVHELQHALRLCGLDDLADNFKI